MYRMLFDLMLISWLSSFVCVCGPNEPISKPNIIVIVIIIKNNNNSRNYPLYLIIYIYILAAEILSFTNYSNNCWMTHSALKKICVCVSLSTFLPLSLSISLFLSLCACVCLMHMCVSMCGAMDKLEHI